MAETKKKTVDPSTDKNLQRECLCFATDLYHHIMLHPTITQHLPPRILGVTRSPFTENVGKAVSLIWYTFRTDIRRLKKFNLKILTSSKMKESICDIIERASEAEKAKHVFQGIQFLSAVLMEVHLFLFQRNYEDYLGRLPVLWTELFQKHYAYRFMDKGGWEPFKSYALDGARKYERYAKEENMTFLFSFCAFMHQKNREFDQTKEMRIFTVQKSLECIQKNWEKSRDIAKRAFVMNIMKRLSDSVRKIAKTCDDSDTGREELNETNMKMSMQLNNFCHQFYDKYEFQKFLIQHIQNKSAEVPQKATEVKTPEGIITGTAYPTETNSEFDEEWKKCVSEIGSLLKIVTPPGTNEESVDLMADVDYTRRIIKEIGAMRVTEYIPEQQEDWTKMGRQFAERARKPVDTEQMLMERIQALEQIQHAEMKSKTPPKESCSKRTVLTPEKATGARPKTTAPEVEGGPSHVAAKASTPEKPESSLKSKSPESSEDRQSDVAATAAISEGSEAKPPRPRPRSRKGSKR